MRFLAALLILFALTAPVAAGQLEEGGEEQLSLLKPSSSPLQSSSPRIGCCTSELHHPETFWREFPRVTCQYEYVSGLDEAWMESHMPFYTQKISVYVYCDVPSNPQSYNIHEIT